MYKLACMKKIRIIRYDTDTKGPYLLERLMILISFNPGRVTTLFFWGKLQVRVSGISDLLPYQLTTTTFYEPKVDEIRFLVPLVVKSTK